jgi:hypothetical protein
VYFAGAKVREHDDFFTGGQDDNGINWIEISKKEQCQL